MRPRLGAGQALSRRAFLAVTAAGAAAGCRPAGGPDAPGEPVRIGEINPLTGREAGLGQAAHLGVVLALAQINAAGGVLGRPVELVAEDSRSTPGESATAIRKLIARDRVVAVIGESHSGRCLEAAPFAQAAGIPLVSPAATHPGVTGVGDRIFRMCFTDPYQGTVMARFARDTLRAATAGLLVDVASPYSTGLAAHFRSEFEARGGRIAPEQRFTSGDRDFRAALTALRGADPDVVFAPCYYPDAGLMLRQAAELGLRASFLGGDGWEAPELVEVAGAAAEGVRFPVHFSSDHPSPAAESFLGAFRQAHGREPTGVSALAYDAAMLLADAIRRAGTTAPAVLRAALAGTRDFPGVTGTMSFDPSRNARKPAVLVQVRDGRFGFLQVVPP